MQQFLESNSFFNQKHENVKYWLGKVEGNTTRAKAVSIYYLVRDGIKYDPFTLLEGTPSLSSDFCLNHGIGYCIPKAALQITLSRAMNIPARLGLADVKNHLSTPKLDELLKSDIFTMHAYVEQFIDGKWVKSTPAFNKELCDLTNTPTLEFDGLHNSLFHPYTSDGAKHMEYIQDHGYFSEMPCLFISENCKLHYPHLAITLIDTSRL